MRGDLGEDLLLVKLRQHLALVHVLIDVDVELLDEAAGLRLQLDFGDGLNFSRLLRRSWRYHRESLYASRPGSILVPFPRAAMAMPPATTKISVMPPIHHHFLLPITLSSQATSSKNYARADMDAYYPPLRITHDICHKFPKEATTEQGTRIS